MLHNRGKFVTPQPGWAVYLRTNSDENQHAEISCDQQRFAIEKNVLERSDLPVFAEYVDVLTGKPAEGKAYQRLLEDACAGKFSRVIVERADRFGRNVAEALRPVVELHELGVAVCFANQPDFEPVDRNNRVIVALSFDLARRERILPGRRLKAGPQMKRLKGGFTNYAPDG